VEASRIFLGSGLLKRKPIEKNVWKTTVISRFFIKISPLPTGFIIFIVYKETYKHFNTNY